LQHQWIQRKASTQLMLYSSWQDQGTKNRLMMIKIVVVIMTTTKTTTIKIIWFNFTFGSLFCHVLKFFIIMMKTRENAEAMKKRKRKLRENRTIVIDSIKFVTELLYIEFKSLSNSWLTSIELYYSNVYTPWQLCI